MRSFVLGLAFGFGWTPCVGPILGTVLTMAASKDQVIQGGMLLFAYSLGICVPFMLTALALTFSLSLAAGAGRFFSRLHFVAGVVILDLGILLLLGKLEDVAYWLWVVPINIVVLSGIWWWRKRRR